MVTFLRQCFLAFKASNRDSTLNGFLLEKLLRPVATLLFFVFLGTHGQPEVDPTYRIFGNALLITSYQTMFGLTYAVSAERMMGTLKCVFVAPRSLFWFLATKSASFMMDMCFVALLTLLLALGMFDLDMNLVEWSTLGAILLASQLSAVAFGICLSVFCLLLENILLATNTAWLALMLLTGVNIEHSRMPEWLALFSSVLPVTHSAAATRHLLSGAPLHADLVGELLVSAGYGITALIALKLFYRIAYRRGNFDFF